MDLALASGIFEDKVLLRTTAISVSVRLSVRPYISKITCPSFTKCSLQVVRGRAGSSSDE